MRYQALLVPSEAPTTLREIKRALLTYDRVVLPDPADRDMIPANALTMAAFGVPLLGLSMGDARPLGKLPDHDDAFERTLDACGPAVQQGLVEVRSTYAIARTKGFTLGGVPTGGYPLDVGFVFWLYRSMAEDQAFLGDALADTTSLTPFLGPEEEALEGIALKGQADGTFNEVQALPILERTSGGIPSLQATQIARGRIAAFIKYAGYCEQKDLIPVFPQSIYSGILGRLVTNTAACLATQEDPFWHRRSRVLDLCHEEFLPPDYLDDLSMEEVLRLRSKAWGAQAEAREALFQAVFALALEHAQRSDFRQSVRNAITEYRQASQALLNEREKVGFRIKCDLGKLLLGGGSGLIGLLTQAQSPLASIGATLAVGGIWALDRAQDYGPQLLELRQQETELKRGAGFALHSYFSGLQTR